MKSLVLLSLSCSATPPHTIILPSSSPLQKQPIMGDWRLSIYFSAKRGKSKRENLCVSERDQRWAHHPWLGLSPPGRRQQLALARPVPLRHTCPHVLLFTDMHNYTDTTDTHSDAHPYTWETKWMSAASVREWFGWCSERKDGWMCGEKERSSGTLAWRDGEQEGKSWWRTAEGKVFKKGMREGEKLWRGRGLEERKEKYECAQMLKQVGRRSGW